MEQKNHKTVAKYAVLLVAAFAFSQCRSRASQEPTGESGNEVQYAAQKSNCAKAVPQLTTNREVTWMYHWTNRPLALSNPLEHVRQSVAGGAKNNKEGKPGGAAGAGLYLASDPFSSLNYGKILVRVPIKANVLIANWDHSPNNPDLDVYLKSGCTSILYIFGSQYDSFNFGMDRALVLSSMDTIETESAKITSFSRGDDESKKGSQQPEIKITDLPTLFRTNGTTEILGAATVASIILGSPSKKQAEQTQAYQGFSLICSKERKTPDTAMLDSAFQAFKKLPEFLQYIKDKEKFEGGIDLTDRVGLNFHICNYIKDKVVFPNQNKEQIYPVDQTKIYLAAWGLDIGSPPPATRDALETKLIQLYLNLPEVKSNNAMVQFIADYLKKEAPQSIDKWR